MAPGILSDSNVSTQDAKSNTHASEPFKPTGALDRFGFEDVTPIIGREFSSLNIVDDLLNAENADDLLRELAITSILILLVSNDHCTDLDSLTSWSRLFPFAEQPH